MDPKVKEAFRIAQIAHNAGYATRTNKRGELQFVVVDFDKKGNSLVRPVTDWLSHAEALEILAG